MTESVWLDAGGEKGGREEGKTEREREGKKRTIVDVSLHAKWLPFLPGKEIFLVTGSRFERADKVSRRGEMACFRSPTFAFFDHEWSRLWFGSAR